jgi:hypothetical protein
MNSFTKVIQRAHGAKEHFHTTSFDQVKVIKNKNRSCCSTPLLAFEFIASQLYFSYCK